MSVPVLLVGVLQYSRVQEIFKAHLNISRLTFTGVLFSPGLDGRNIALDDIIVVMLLTKANVAS